MAWTQADIDTLKTAIAARGLVKTMTIADRTYTFDSVDDMLKLLAVMQQDVAGTSRTRFAATSKGFSRGF